MAGRTSVIERRIVLPPPDLSHVKGVRRGPQPEPTNPVGAIVLCGGMGTRISPITKNRMPKSLVRVAGKPLITYTLDQLDMNVIGTVVFSTGHYAKMLESWVDSQELQSKVVKVRRAGQTIASKVTEIAQLFPTMDPLIVFNSDEIRLNFSLTDLIKWHQKAGSAATAVVTDPRKAVGSSVVYKIAAGGSRVVDMTKRDALTQDHIRDGWLQHAGVLVLRRDAVQHLRPEIDDFDGSINRPLVEAGLLNAFINRGLQYFNVNDPHSVKEAEHAVRLAQA